jgi:Fe-S oxidoreductase
MNEPGRGVNFAELMQEIRTYAFQNGLLAEEIGAKTTHGSVMQVMPQLQADCASWVNKIDFLKKESGLTIADSGEIGYFLGCAESLEGIFYSYDVHYTDISKSTIRLLNAVGITPAVIENKCCGHDRYWLGDTDTAKRLAEFNIQKFKDAGIKTLIISCAEGYRMWQYEYPKLVGELPFTIKHISEYLWETGLWKKLSVRDRSPITITYHDPCRLGRLGGIYDPPRDLLRNLPGITLVEMENNKSNAQCCGVSGFMNCSSDSRILRESRIKEAQATGANYLITTCPKCITHFNCYLQQKDGPIKDGTSEVSNPEYYKIMAKPLRVMDFTTFIARRVFS